MTIAQLIEMSHARLAYLSALRTSAVSLGDVAQVAAIDAESASTQATLNQLLTLV